MECFNFSSLDRYKYQSNSSGNQIKWFYDNKFIKADNFHCYESIAEFLTSFLCKYIDNIEFVDYRLCKIIEDNKIEYEGCFSNNLIVDDYSLLSIYDLLKRYYFDVDSELNRYHGEDLLNFILEFFDSNFQIDIFDYLHDICFLDAITLNSDRHLDNIFFVDYEGNLYQAPILDNGASLLSQLGAVPNWRSYIPMVSSKPFCVDFEEQCELFDSVPLKLNFGALIIDLASLSVDFKLNEFNQAKEILLYQLRRTKGVLWMNK